MKRGRRERKLLEVDKFKGMMELYYRDILTTDEIMEFFGISSGVYYKWKKQIEAENLENSNSESEKK